MGWERRLGCSIRADLRLLCDVVAIDPVELRNHALRGQAASQFQDLMRRPAEWRAQMILPGVPTGSPHHLGCPVLPVSLIGFQGSRNIARLRCQRLAEHPGVFQGQIAALGHKGQGWMRCVSQQGNRPAVPMGGNRVAEQSPKRAVLHLRQQLRLRLRLHLRLHLKNLSLLYRKKTMRIALTNERT